MPREWLVRARRRLAEVIPNAVVWQRSNLSLLSDAFSLAPETAKGATLTDPQSEGTAGRHVSKSVRSPAQGLLIHPRGQGLLRKVRPTCAGAGSRCLGDQKRRTNHGSGDSAKRGAAKSSTVKGPQGLTGQSVGRRCRECCRGPIGERRRRDGGGRWVGEELALSAP